jgi:3-oxoacyl-[acyl-carrier protein] reductase
MLSRQVADEVGKHGIRINCVSPSTILTEQIEQHLSPERQQQVIAQHSLGRLGMPEDVALATLYLASDASSWITGITLDVAGGKIMP